MDYPAGVSELSMSVLMTPDKANFSGNVHGGVLLKYLDEVAYACASRYAGRYVVTLSVDQVMFRQPVHVGELVTFMASVNYTGRTSMEIGIKVITEDIRQRSVRHTNSCFFTMVALDSSGKPTAVPPLELRPANNAAALPRPNSAGASAPNWSSATRRCAKASRTSEPQGRATPPDHPPPGGCAPAAWPDTGPGRHAGRPRRPPLHRAKAGQTGGQGDWQPLTLEVEGTGLDARQQVLQQQAAGR